ncbi:hypothetical protein ACFFTN_13320 [Aminobacter aganoensis]|uniref:Uncharacterized protein n=1 Tax=Aminobacter aganoensis TaxID=83264 RepID=A0A7X0F9P4_9HYPH|nr:hypothetical protein [Aminobacter aganoensis]MBB6355706.1 hypothetical protein [Aminobacter aganoensis]
MRTMTRPEFEAYERRVEDVLTKVGKLIDEADLQDFGEVVAAAREVVEMRRAHLEITEQQVAGEPAQINQKAQSPNADERYHHQTADAANEALNEIRIARNAISRIAASEHSILPVAAYRDDLDRGLEMAANLAVHWNNKHVLEFANNDTELVERIERLEKIRDEHGISYSAGSDGSPIPEVAKSDAQLLGYYKEGLEHLKAELAIADHESGLAIGGWGPAAEYWTEQDSDAAWARYDQLRADLLEAESNLARAMEKTEVETPAVEVVNAAGESASDRTARSSDQTAEATFQDSARDDAVARHGEKAVAAGEALLERLLEAGREMRDSEARMGRHREGDREQDTRSEKLVEATANYNQILRQAAREVVAGNGYIRDGRLAL